MAFPAISSRAESFFSIVGNVITKPRNNLSPATTIMLAAVKYKVTKIRLCVVDLGIESGNTNIDDDPDLCAKINRDINDDIDVCVEITRDIDGNSDDIMEKDVEDCDSNCFCD